MAGFKGAGRPGDIPSPVAVAPPPQGVAAPIAVNTDLSQMQANIAAQVPPPAAEPDLDALAASIDSGQEPNLDDLAGQIDSGQGPAVDNAPMDDSTTMSDLGQQARLSFASSEEQKRATLEKTYGADNVRKVDDNYQVKRDGKWKKFDRSAWDLVKDVYAMGLNASVGGVDLAGQLSKLPFVGGVASGDGRIGTVAEDVASNAAPAFKEAVALPGEVAAAALASSGVGAPVAVPVAAASRMAGGAAGEYLATALQGPLDLENPEDVTGAASNRRALINGTIRAATGMAGDKIATWAARKAESRLANKAILDSLPEQTVINDVKDLAQMDQAMGQLKKSGALSPEFNLRPDQVVPTPELRGAAQQASKSQTFRDMVEKQGAMVYDAALKVFSHAGNIQAGPSKAASLIKTADDAAGALIGEARQALDGESIVGSRTNAYLQGLEDPTTGLGFKTTNTSNGMMGNNSTFGADKDVLERSLNITQKGSLLPKRFEKRIQDVKALFVNNGGKIDGQEANKLYTGLVREINSLKSPETFGYRSQLIQLKNAIRDDVADAIESKTGAGGAALYGGSMKRYRSFRAAEDSLGKLFDEGEMTTESLSRYIFNKSDKSLERIQTIKKLLTSQNPQAWDDLKGNFLQGLMEKHKLEGPKADRLGGYDWAKIGDEVDGLGREVVHEIFDTPEAVGQFKAFTKIASALKRSDFDFLTGPKSLPLTKKLKDSAGAIIKAIHHQSPGHLNEALDMWTHMAPDDLAIKYITNGGDAEILKMVPTREKSVYKDFFAQVVKRYEQTGARRAVQFGTTGTMAIDGANKKR